ncbi:AAA family ATPase, partial [Acinetobacter baumannii]
VNQHIYNLLKINFQQIVENLRLIFFPKITPAEADQFRDLCQNSLGYNNLLYIASILAELTLTKGESLYRLLLIEEPEAHLHPQMQEVFINQLNVAVQKLSENYSNKDKWNIQFVITTHSPHVANAA